MENQINLELLIQIGILGCLVIIIFKALEIREELDRINVEMKVGIDKINENLRDVVLK
jgi:hypothetical protein